jgi:phosphoenolpyruvate-protein kinase (PTS system EI component)
LRINAKAAVKAEFGDYARQLAALDDPYFKSRAQDLEDVSMQLLRCLRGQKTSGAHILIQPSAIVSDDLAQSYTFQFKKDPWYLHCPGRPNLAYGHPGS